MQLPLLESSVSFFQIFHSMHCYAWNVCLLSNAWSSLSPHSLHFRQRLVFTLFRVQNYKKDSINRVIRSFICIFTPNYHGQTIIKVYKFRMLSRYKKIKEDSRFPAAEDKRQYPFCDDSAAKLLSSISFYLHLSPSIYKACGACES